MRRHPGVEDRWEGRDNNVKKMTEGATRLRRAFWELCREDLGAEVLHWHCLQT